MGNGPSCRNSYTEVNADGLSSASLEPLVIASCAFPTMSTSAAAFLTVPDRSTLFLPTSLETRSPESGARPVPPNEFEPINPIL